MKSKIALLSLTIILLIGYSCDPNKGLKEKPQSLIPDSVLMVNNWIWDDLDYFYLWRQYLPKRDLGYSETISSNFFDKLLFVDDHWSYFTNDFGALMAELDNESKSFGMNFQLYYADSTYSNVIGVVQYVVPNSPAANASVKRGDIFNTINGKVITVSNYQTLLSNDSYDLGITTQTSTGYSFVRNTGPIVAIDLKEDPILVSKTIDYQGKKIGYLMYNSFVFTDVDSANLVDKFKEFKANNIDALVLDLRYNGGGSGYIANLIASMIAPLGNVTSQNIFYRSIWNDNLQTYFINNEGSDSPNLVTRFINNVPVNLNLSTLYICTLSGTASASEMVINCLDPYLNMVTIGDTTHGKYTGMIPVCADPKWENEALYEPMYDKNDKLVISPYGMLPIMFKDANVNGVTDFKSGLSPDVYLPQDDYHHELGSIYESYLNQALFMITGVRPSEASPSFKSASMARFGKRIYQMKGHPGKMTDILYDKKDISRAMRMNQ